VIAKICELFRGKKILILGFGQEGQSTYAFLRRCLPELDIGIADRGQIEMNLPTSVSLHTGPDYQDSIAGYDLVIKSPGVVLERFDQQIGAKMTSQTEIFLKFYGGQTIGITGTKGKSTTASLLEHIFKAARREVLLIGNIGVPAFEVLDQIGPDTVVIYELSSHQLEYVDCSPHVAVLLNVFEEHLDHYGSLAKYIEAKENIYRFQNPDDYLICNRTCVKPGYGYQAYLITVSDEAASADVVIHDGSITYQGKSIALDPDELYLKGEHNLFNIGVCYVLAAIYGITEPQFMAAVKTFLPLPHRMEFIGNFQGVDYYDDSISTIGEATIQAVKSLKNIGTVILGGMDRGIDYVPLADYLLHSGIEAIVLMPDTGYKIKEIMSARSSGTYQGKQVVMTSGLPEAVEIAKKITPPGKICLFSPAAASYGYFKNFAERGEMFQKYVKQG